MNYIVVKCLNNNGRCHSIVVKIPNFVVIIISVTSGDFINLYIGRYFCSSPLSQVWKEYLEQALEETFKINSYNFKLYPYSETKGEEKFNLFKTNCHHIQRVYNFLKSYRFKHRNRLVMQSRGASKKFKNASCYSDLKLICGNDEI